MIETGPDSDRWQKITTLLGAVMDLEPVERSAFLDRECSGDKSLKQEVMALLGSEEEMQGFLVSPLFVWHETSTLAPGTRLDAYCILHEIGRGGMGVVYLAERSDDYFEKQVAIKVLKRGMDTDEILRRFHRERQILAQFEHPNIARLIDAGSTPDGLPYFVLEYVSGIPIDRYCDARRMSVKERLSLFCSVCGAVHFAHQNLVIHRDLKPTNVLVTADGTPKLVDFGIAKVLRRDADPTRTARDQQLLTPDYASPEQLLGQALTTASDVYSLGVLLFQLLTGKKPYHIDSFDRSEMARVVTEFEPLRPSVVAAHGDRLANGDGTHPEKPSDHGRFGKDCPPRALSRILSGDLDIIVLTALRKEPQRRYATVTALTEDVERYLAEMPIKARKDTVSYRASKFVRRHKLAVLGVILIVLFTLGFTTLLVLQLRQTALERDRAEQLLDFSIELADLLNPTHADPDQLQKEEVLEGVEDLVRSGFKQHPADQADLLDRIGRLYRAFGELEEARGMLEQALYIRRPLGDEKKVAASLHNLAFLLHEMGDDGTAEPFLREALEIQKGLYPDGKSAELARGLNNLASLLGSRGDHSGAATLYREVLAIKEELHGKRHVDVALALNNLATSLIQLHREAAAEPYLREALSQNREFLKPTHPRIAENLNNLAKLLENRREYDAAERHYNEALELKKKSLGENHPKVAFGLNNLAFCVQAAGRPEEAVTLYRQALRILARQDDQNPRVQAIIQRNLASGFSASGHGEAGESLAREALATMENIREVPWRIADARSVLGHCLMLQGKYDQARPLILESLAEIGRGAGEDSRYYLEARARVSRLHQAMEDTEEAANR